jgi:hypothetical protein
VSGRRGQAQAGLPRLHVRVDHTWPARALCGAKRKLGLLFAQEARTSDCHACRARLDAKTPVTSAARAA